VIDFADDGGRGFRVVGLFPQSRHEILADLQMGTELNLKAQAALTLPLPTADGSSVGEVSARIYGRAEAAVGHRAVRRVVEADIVKGTGARWRLENSSDSLTLEAESHRLGVIAEVSRDIKTITAAGYLEAVSDPQWLTAPISDVFDHIATALRQFLSKGAPLQAYAEWTIHVP
jgi:hypothetical protein